MKRGMNYVAVAMSAGLLAQSVAGAAIVNLDLRINGQSGAAAKAQQVTAGTIVNLDIYAVLLGANSDSNISNDGVVSMATRFTSTEGATALLGDFTNATRSASFSGLGSNGAQAAGNGYDSNPDKEWGGAFPSTSTTGYFNAGSLSVVGGTAVGNNVEVLLGTIRWTAGATVPSGASTSLQIVPFVNSSTNNGSFSVRINNSNTSNQNAATNIGQAGPVVITTAAPVVSNFLSLSSTGVGEDKGDVVVLGSNGGYQIKVLDIADSTSGYVDLFENSTATPFPPPTIILLDTNGVPLPEGTNLNGAVLVSGPEFAAMNLRAGGGFDFGYTLSGPGSIFSFDFGSVVLDRVAVVPEPTSLGLVTLGAAALLRRRHRA